MVCRNQRNCLGDLLEDLLDALQTAGMLKGRAKIIDAKVPIIKCTLDYGMRPLLRCPGLKCICSS